MNRMFNPGPKSYTHLLDRLSRQLDQKYRDHSTALDFALKATPPKSEVQEQEALFVAPPVSDAPQVETLFSPDEIS